jgi:hypothetical protein
MQRPRLVPGSFFVLGNEKTECTVGLRRSALIGLAAGEPAVEEIEDVLDGEAAAVEITRG